MAYKGHIRNGTIVLDEPVQLPEGAEVMVDVVQSERVVPLSELLADRITSSTDLPPDAAKKKRHYLYGHRKQ